MVQKRILFLLLGLMLGGVLGAKGFPSYLEFFTLDFAPMDAEAARNKVASQKSGLTDLSSEQVLDFCEAYLLTGEKEDLASLLQTAGLYAKAVEEQWPGNQAVSLWIFGGWDALIKGNVSLAHAQFAGAWEQDSSKHSYFWLRVGEYLKAYDEGSLPVFGGFNGGLGNFLLEKIGAPDSSLSFQAKEMAQDFYPLMLYAPENPLLLELFGDILYYDPDPFLSRWFSSLAYLRAAQQYEEESEDFVAFEKKSIYSLESDRINPQTYNQYRFTQFQKTLERDLEAAAARQDSLQKMAPSSYLIRDSQLAEFFPDTDRGQLMGLLGREQKKEMQLSARKNNPNSELTNPDLDVKKIKSTAKFNVYAILLIGLVIGAVVFFWVQIKKNSRD